MIAQSATGNSVNQARTRPSKSQPNASPDDEPGLIYQGDRRLPIKKPYVGAIEDSASWYWKRARSSKGREMEAWATFGSETIQSHPPHRTGHTPEHVQRFYQVFQHIETQHEIWRADVRNWSIQVQDQGFVDVPGQFLADGPDLAFERDDDATWIAGFSATPTSRQLQPRHREFAALILAATVRCRGGHAENKSRP